MPLPPRQGRIICSDVAYPVMQDGCRRIFDRNKALVESCNGVYYSDIDIMCWEACLQRRRVVYSNVRLFIAHCIHKPSWPGYPPRSSSGAHLSTYWKALTKPVEEGAYILAKQEHVAQDYNVQWRHKDLKVRFLSFHPPSDAYPYINLVSNGSDEMHRADTYENRILGNFATTDQIYMDMLNECWCSDNRFRQGFRVLRIQGLGCTHRPLSSSFLGLPYGILDINHKKELLRGLWVGIRV